MCVEERRRGGGCCFLEIYNSCQDSVQEPFFSPLPINSFHIFLLIHGSILWSASFLFLVIHLLIPLGQSQVNFFWSCLLHRASFKVIPCGPSHHRTSPVNTLTTGQVIVQVQSYISHGRSEIHHHHYFLSLTPFRGFEGCSVWFLRQQPFNLGWIVSLPRLAVENQSACLFEDPNPQSTIAFPPCPPHHATPRDDLSLIQHSPPHSLTHPVSNDSSTLSHPDAILDNSSVHEPRVYS